MKSTQRCQEMLEKCTVKGFNSFSPGGAVKDLDFPFLLDTLLEEIQETITYDDLRKVNHILNTISGKIFIKKIAKVSFFDRLWHNKIILFITIELYFQNR